MIGCLVRISHQQIRVLCGASPPFPASVLPEAVSPKAFRKNKNGGVEASYHARNGELLLRPRQGENGTSKVVVLRGGER